MVDIEELTKRYGKFVALDHMNLHIDKGDQMVPVRRQPCGSCADSLKPHRERSP